MRVFVTGATGFVGSAVVQELLGAGHKVLGLARSDASADALKKLGVDVHRGELTDTDGLASGARVCDGVIHTAFIHDFSKYQENSAIDLRAIEAMTAAIEGTGKPFVISSGVAMLKPGQVGTEEDEGDTTSMAAGRVKSEIVTVAKAARGVRSSVIRLSPTVHGDGDHGFVPALIGIARAKGVSAYVGEGRNRWPAVHRLDAANLYRLALEKGEAGSRFHGVAEEGVATRDIATMIGRRLNLPVVSKAPEEAGEHFGFLGMFFAVDCPASSALTKKRLGWKPTHPGLLADLEGDYYFAN